MGTGKSKWLVQWLRTNNYANVLFITHRVSLAIERQRGLPDYVVYKNATKAVISDPKLIIQYESLRQLCPKMEAPDVLVMDEIKSIISQIHSVETNKANLKENAEKFKWLVSNAKVVICIDANLTRADIEFIMSIRPQDAPLIINNTAQIPKPRVEFVCDEQMLRVQIFEAGKCAKTEPFFIASGVKAFAKEIVEQLKTQNETLNIGLFTGDSSDEVKEQLSRINEEWSKLDVVVYTPTISAGNSFERHHFARGFAYFTSELCDPKRDL